MSNPPGISSFIPDTTLQFAWDSTSLGLLKTCPRKYQYTIVEGWRHRGESVHLLFGSWYHQGLELYDRKRAEGASHIDAERAVVRSLLEATWDHNGVPGPWESDHNTKTRNTLIRSVVWYLEQFGDNDPVKTVILSDGKPAVELSFRWETGWWPAAGGDSPYLLCGHLDRVGDFLGQTYIVDRKTSGTTLSQYFFQRFDIDNQMSLYSLTGKVSFGLPIAGVMIDGAQIAVGFTRFERGFTHRSAGQLDEFYENLRHWLALAEKFSAEDHWPMNEMSCDNYGGCVFRGICSKDPGVRQRFLESEFTQRFWNPLDVR